tara:strand:- start:431 stop:628 length:198 start_codon:yes stop_codon:yes gene_type:complete
LLVEELLYDANGRESTRGGIFLRNSETPLVIPKNNNVAINRKIFLKKLPKTRKYSRSFISWHDVR